MRVRSARLNGNIRNHLQQASGRAELPLWLLSVVRVAVQSLNWIALCKLRMRVAVDVDIGRGSSSVPVERVATRPNPLRSGHSRERYPFRTREKPGVQRNQKFRVEIPRSRDTFPGCVLVSDSDSRRSNVEIAIAFCL